MSEKLKKKIEKRSCTQIQGDFFNVSISYRSKLVFQLICLISAPQFKLKLKYFCSRLWFLLPDQAVHLSKRKRNFNERDTHCKIKKKNRDGFLSFKI